MGGGAISDNTLDMLPICMVWLVVVLCRGALPGVCSWIVRVGKSGEPRTGRAVVDAWVLGL